MLAGVSDQLTTAVEALETAFTRLSAEPTAAQGGDARPCQYYKP
jgi:hypothetical protein